MITKPLATCQRCIMNFIFTYISRAIKYCNNNSTKLTTYNYSQFITVGSVSMFMYT